jgi:signal transduction histidine kinase
MVEDLLSAAELERGESTRQPEPVDLTKVVRDAAADHRVIGREIHVEAPPVAVVVCDHEYVRRILDNLVDNAFKYGKPPVRIEVTGEAAHVTLSVLDAGHGVAEEDREKVFERFHRLDTMNGHGLGLGLSVVQGLVEAMGGSIRAEEAPGGGAAFRIRFPRLARQTSEGALAASVGPRTAPAPSEISRSVS